MKTIRLFVTQASAVLLSAAVALANERGAAEDSLYKENLPHSYAQQCNKTMLDRSTENLDKDSYGFKFATSEKIIPGFVSAFELGQKIDTRSPWTRSLYASANMRARILLSNTFSFEKDDVLSRITQTKNLLDSYVDTADPLPANSPTDNYLILRNNLAIKGLSRVSAAEFIGRFICSPLLGILNSDCNKQTEYLFSKVQKQIQFVIEEWSIAVDDENLVNVITNPRYRKGLVLSAKKIFSHFAHAANYYSEGQLIESLSPNEFQKREDYFLDLKDSFVESGMPEAEANEAAWNVIGAIANRGPNFSVLNIAWPDSDNNENLHLKTLDLSKPETQFVALRIISTVLPLIDHYSSTTKGYIYTLPKSVVASCNSGKSYHFLLAAYLARKMTQDLGDWKKSAATVFSFSKIYNGLARTLNLSGYLVTGRKLYSDSKDPGSLESILSTSLNPESLSGQTIFMDIGYSAIGAIYGAQLATGSIINVNLDQTIAQLQQSSDSSESFSTYQLLNRSFANFIDSKEKKFLVEKYLEFEKNFAPDRAFFNGLQQIGQK